MARARRGTARRTRRIAARLARVFPEDIVLMHDGGRSVNRPSELVQVLPAFLAALGRDGLAAGLLPDSITEHRVKSSLFPMG